jgi:hypothetical protein
LWLADVDSNTPIKEMFGQTMTQEDFLIWQLQKWTQRIKANPEETELYLERALIYITVQDYDRANVDLQTFKGLLTPRDKHLYFMICWWGWLYCIHDLFNEGEFIMLSAAELIPMFPNTQLGLYGQLQPVKNLVSLYEKWGKPEKAEYWQAKLPQTEAKIE